LVRVRTPDVLFHRLGLIVPKAHDCGDHQWYLKGDGRDACYHGVAIRPSEIRPR
jgi:hypothetical protein